MAKSADLRTQAAIANRTGLAQTTIGRILKAQVSATLDNVESIAYALNVTAAELLGDAPSLTELSDWANEFNDLPSAERERVIQFIKFTIDQSKVKPKNETFNLVDTSGEPMPEVRDSALRAAGRVLNKAVRKATLNYETPQAAPREPTSKAK